MPIYEASFLGEPIPITKRKKKKMDEPTGSSDAPPVLPTPPVNKRKKKNAVEETTEDPNKPTPVKKQRKPRAPKPVEPPSPPPPAEAPPKVPLKNVRKKVIKAFPTPSLTSHEDQVDSKESTEPAKLPKKKKTATVPTVSETVQEAGTEPQKIKKRKIIDQRDGQEDEPPSWFKSYVLDEQKRRNAEKSRKEKQPSSMVKAAAHEIASQKWGDGFTRDKVKNEVDNHMSRLYSMIHGRRF